MLINRIWIIVSKDNKKEETEVHAFDTKKAMEDWLWNDGECDDVPRRKWTSHVVEVKGKIA